MASDHPKLPSFPPKPGDPVYELPSFDEPFTESSQPEPSDSMNSNADARNRAAEAKRRQALRWLEAKTHELTQWRERRWGFRPGPRRSGSGTAVVLKSQTRPSRPHPAPPKEIVLAEQQLPRDSVESRRRYHDAIRAGNAGRIRLLAFDWSMESVYRQRCFQAAFEMTTRTERHEILRRALQPSGRAALRSALALLSDTRNSEATKLAATLQPDLMALIFEDQIEEELQRLVFQIAMEAFEQKQQLELLAWALWDNSDEHTLRALEVLSSMDPKQAASVLPNLSPGLGEDFGRSLRSATNNWLPPSLMPIIKTLARHERREVRATAIELIGRSGTTTDILWLQELEAERPEDAALLNRTQDKLRNKLNTSGGLSIVKETEGQLSVSSNADGLTSHIKDGQ